VLAAMAVWGIEDSKRNAANIYNTKSMNDFPGHS